MINNTTRAYLQAIKAAVPSTQCVQKLTTEKPTFGAVEVVLEDLDLAVLLVDLVLGLVFAHICEWCMQRPEHK